jgi:hypothetical protein
MRFWAISILALVLMPPAASAKHHDIQFPANGTSYREARAQLLKQGLVAVARDPRVPVGPKRVAAMKHGLFIPEPVPFAVRSFPEIHCFKFRKSVDCSALFLAADKRGWRNYVVVLFDPKADTVTDVHYPSDVEGLPAVPQPLAADVPQLKGSYSRARKTLQALGFRPVRNRHPFGGEIAPETQCTGAGTQYCLAYWLSRDGRVLRITTINERPQIYFVQWSTWRDLKVDFLDK